MKIRFKKKRKEEEQDVVESTETERYSFIKSYRSSQVLSQSHSSNNDFKYVNIYNKPNNEESLGENGNKNNEHQNN